MSTRRRTRGALAWLLATLAALVLLSTRTVPHPIGSARTFGKYEGKAATTSESALSGVATVSLAVETAERDNAFGPYTATLVSDAEEAISGVQSTFDSIQPPDRRADDVQRQLDKLLTDAADHVRDVRVAVRRGNLHDLRDVAAPLRDDARRLKAFLRRHG